MAVAMGNLVTCAFCRLQSLREITFNKKFANETDKSRGREYTLPLQTYYLKFSKINLHFFFFFSSLKPPGVQVIKLIYVFLEVSLLIFDDEKFNKESVAPC